MQTISKEEFEQRMMRIRFVLWNAWTDAYGLEVIDNSIKRVEEKRKLNVHLVSILNHYRKLMQYDLCLSVTRVFETNGHNSLSNIQKFAMEFKTGDWGKFPSVMSSEAYKKAKAYRDGYLAHLDVDVSAEPLTNNEMKSLLESANEFFNNVCVNVGMPEWGLSNKDLALLQMKLYYDFMEVLQPHIKDVNV